MSPPTPTPHLPWGGKASGPEPCPPFLPPSEAAVSSVWLTLYYSHPTRLVRAVTSSSQSPPLLFLLYLYRLPPGSPSTCPVSLCSSDWTPQPPPRAVIDGGVIVSLSVTLKAPSWSGLLHHLKSTEYLCPSVPFLFFSYFFSVCANLIAGLHIPCLSNQRVCDWFSRRSLRNSKRSWHAGSNYFVILKKGQ